MTQFPFFLDYSKHFSLKDFTRAVISVSTTWTCSFSARTWFWIAYLIYSKPQEISQLKTLGLAKTSEKKKKLKRKTSCCTATTTKEHVNAIKPHSIQVKRKTQAYLRLKKLSTYSHSNINNPNCMKTVWIKMKFWQIHQEVHCKTLHLSLKEREREREKMYKDVV